MSNRTLTLHSIDSDPTHSPPAASATADRALLAILTPLVLGPHLVLCYTLIFLGGTALTTVALFLGAEVYGVVSTVTMALTAGGFFLMFAGGTLLSLMACATSICMMVHSMGSPRLSGEQRLLWCLAVFFGGPVGQIAYWALHLRPTPRR